MRQYIIRRILLMLVTLFLVTFMVFSLSRLIPGDVVQMMFEEKGYAEDLKAMRAKLGLDRAIHVQYLIWMSKVVRGDLGTSLWTKRDVLQEIGRRWPVTLELGLISLCIALIMSIPIGVISAIRQDSFIDYALRSTAIGLLSMPPFWIAILIITVPSLWFHWMPVKTFIHFSDDPLGNIRQFLIPAFCMQVAMAGRTMRMTRAMMLEVLRQDYIRTAWSKGLRERVVITRHALKNALIPIITIVGSQSVILIGGSVVMEQIFGLPGLGRHMFHVISQRDYPMIQGINLAIASFVVVMNLMIDISYAYLDPRIRYR